MSNIIRSLKAVNTMDGDQVELKRVFGYPERYVFDPFLLLDHAKDEYPKTGFPWHPHRGIETITYLVKGKLFHEDSLGNKGTLESGDVQWMQSGSGILHQEFPDRDSPVVELLQFWLNMPKNNKMDEPIYYYTNIKDENIVPVNGGVVSVVAGEYNLVKGPVQKPERNIKMLFIKLHKGFSITLDRQKATNAFIYVLSGKGEIDEEINEFHVYQLSEESLQLFAKEDMEFVFAEGTPLNESIEWYGPIVMNTKQEIRTAKEELNSGTFIKHQKTVDSSNSKG